ncbi:MAG: thiamine pyrophosphate protein [Micavibrio sp.]|nr:MAG: thiamine pyrophosphate protein [Micavibrio sp.]
MAHGGKILVESLNAHGVRRVSCVAGESYLPVLDALLDYPDIEVITCRQESGASFMADGWGNLNDGAPGVAFVTRGPGACNASIGLHTAMQASTPVILFVGLINTKDRGREAFQEFDLEQMFGSLSKWAAVIDKAEDIPEMVAKAFHVAGSGRPGPVVLGLPEDILFPDVSGVQQVTPLEVSEIAPKADDVAAIQEALQGAEKPIVLVGGSLWGDEDCRALENLAKNSNLPVVTSFRRQDIFNHKHECYGGELGTGPNPKLVERMGQADLVLILNARVNEITTQSYAIVQGGDQKIVHVHPSSSVFGKGCKADIEIESQIAPMAKALADMKIDGGKWEVWCQEARRDYEEWSGIDKTQEQNWDGADVTQIFGELRELLPEDAIITGDAGNFSGWVQRYLHYGRPGRLLAPVSGAMGYAVPSAVGAAIARPDKTVVGFCGDGGFMMTGQELATAAHHGAKPIILVFNNSVFGTIRMHQEREYPGRHSGTDLTNPDFVKLGESYGAFAARVEKAADFKNAWDEALKSGKAALIEIVMDPRQSTTRSEP